MNETAAARDKFCALLRELFQFEHSAGLDFGIYRIMNHKREVIEQFIGKDLADEIDRSARAAVRGARTERLAALENLAKAIKENFGEDALDADGELNEKWHNTPKGTDYLNAQKSAANILGENEMEANAFSHLYCFFNRYYEGGDFISKRFYSRRPRFAVPYNGEEVHLHWANRDQYYIKTGEYFSRYAFQCGGWRVRFEVRDADVEKDNRKGDARFFFPLASEASCGESEVVVPFVFRPLNGDEKANGNGKQEEILKDALPGIEKNLSAHAKAALLAVAEGEGEGEKTTVLEKHMRRYARRNTMDYFIHKDLRGFLSRELDYFIKNEVLNLDDLEQAGELAAEGRFHLMKIVRAIGVKIIAFLAQIENFQKQLFEKKKFVIETHYCVAAGRIVDESLRREILGNKNQWAEWSAMSGRKINGAKARRDFMQSNPTLMVDTAHFGAEFKDKLLAQFKDIDGECDGVLLSGENFQGLNLLAEKYRGQVDCIHIDPPYNTNTSGFLYKNGYQHSSWMTMMENRIEQAQSLLTKDGVFVCHIDENEYENLKMVFDLLPVADAGTVIWDKRNPMNAGRGVATQHEYMIWRTNNAEPLYLLNRNIVSMINTAQSIIDKHGGVTESAKKEFAAWAMSNKALSGGEKAYRNLDENGQVFRSVSLRAPEPRTDPKFFEPLIHPVTGKPCPVPPNGFSRTPETLAEMQKRGEIIFGKDETVQPRQKTVMTVDSKRQISSLIHDAHKGKADLDKLGLNFPYCHPVSLYITVMGVTTQEKGGVAVDFFAGSGTTGHAVINLNREDGGRRKFILMEMGEYFDSVLLPRLKKIAWTPEWKDGKPKRAATEEETARAPRMFKIQRLESYEDALENITFTDDDSAQSMMDFPDYLLGYMLQWETRESKTCLNTEQLQTPFDYRLRLRRNGDFAEASVDVAETFNYLLGLHVQTRKIYTDGKRRYLVCTGLTGNRPATVIWRNTAGWSNADFEHDRDFVAKKKLTAGADKVYVNNDSLIPGAESLDGVFKGRLLGKD